MRGSVIGIGYVAYVLSFQKGRESPQEGRWMRLLAWLRAGLQPRGTV
jgi:hypothetical protein